MVSRSIDARLLVVAAVAGIAVVYWLGSIRLFDNLSFAWDWWAVVPVVIAIALPPYLMRLAHLDLRDFPDHPRVTVIAIQLHAERVLRMRLAALVAPTFGAVAIVLAGDRGPLPILAAVACTLALLPLAWPGSRYIEHIRGWVQSYDGDYDSNALNVFSTWLKESAGRPRMSFRTKR